MPSGQQLVSCFWPLVGFISSRRIWACVPTRRIERRTTRVVSVSVCNPCQFLYACVSPAGTEAYCVKKLSTVITLGHTTTPAQHLSTTDTDIAMPCP
ncbi:unnamed protein product [Protopolystoma xenopodis]|uniref:Uncharacterized protein n=1 Tax=Protopolystoma xenopodis TaxID=117903 RepID=A0A3S5FE30_9PLAT|nr:unnamed protein product [Protopolystoma xenopodis]